MIRDDITGRTEVYGLIGDPVIYSLSPVIQNTLAQRLEHHIVYAPFHVREEALGAAVQGAYSMGIRGLNVTHPHKHNVMKYVCGLDKTAQEVGAVNTLLYTDSGYIGYNTDIYGVRNTLRARGLTLAGKTAVILGAGGGARAAAMAVASEGAARIFIVNRTEENAIFLARHVKLYYNIDVYPLSFAALAEIERAYLVLQATAVGFGQDSNRSPVDLAFLRSVDAEAAFDMIYNPWETEFLKEAGRAGCICINGFDMLLYQAVASYEIWRGQSLPKGLAEELLYQLVAERSRLF